MAQTIITQIAPINQSTQVLTFDDNALINSNLIDSSFNVETDIIETFVYDLNLNFLSSINSSYTVQETNIDNNQIKELYLDPVKDLENSLFNNGIYSVNYNFQRNKLNSSIFNQYYIKEISTDRTELRIDNSSFTNTELRAAYDSFSIDFNTSPVFNGFYLNFNNNNLLLATNISYDEINGRGSILIKLYEPLPNNYDLKTQLWVTEKISESLAYQVEFIPDIITFDDNLYLRGPNLNISIKDQINNSTEYKNFDTLLSSSFTLQNQLDSILVEQRAELNTDYTDYNNFIFFSSAAQRLSNFYDKVKLIEGYNNDINILNTLPNETNVSSSKTILETKINDIIKNFDGYDYYLYFESSSYAWPKSNSTKPYTLYSTGSAQVLNWFGSDTLTSPYYGGQFYSASKYDNENQNNLYNIFPQYLKDDDNNFNFQLFVEMTGQLFDEIWLYTQAISNRNDSDNSLIGGISTDLVADALRSYGLNIYQSSFTDNDLYTTYLGITPDGSTLPPTGSELITNYVTSSAETIPFNDANKLIYKRLYHNLPYLLKKKGTIEGLRLLLTCFGIPDTLLQIVEFGGKNKLNINDWDYFEDRFNYAYSTSGSSFISSSFSLNSSWGALNNVPQAIEFRFKTPGLPINYSQSLWQTDQGIKLTLKYTGSGLLSGSYSASISDPYYQYGFLEFQPESSDINNTASIYLPFFDNSWWSVLINRTSPTNYTLYAKNNIYDGYEGNKIGFQASSSITTTSLDSDWTNSTRSIFASASSIASLFSGSLQEIRYYTQPISESVFNDYAMNALSIEQSERLAFRATLGGELYTGSISTHPKVTGSWAITSSFTLNSNFHISNTSSFITNVETIYYNEPLTGILNRVSNKIQLKDNNLPTKDYSNILSPLRSLSQIIEASESYSRDNNLLEVGLSPQNEIDKDIIEQLGYFNIGEYIGDPRQTHNKLYSELETLRDNYFLKYISSYNYNDYVRLIKYFDNALFKMIKDFTPVRTSIATGIIIKPTILERSKYPEPELSWTRPEYTASIQHYTSSTGVSNNTIYNFSGDNGGVLPLFRPAEYVTVFTTSSLLFSFGGAYSNNYLITSASGDYIITTTLNNSDPGGLLYLVDGTSTADYPSGLKSTTIVTVSNQNLVLSGSFQKGVLFYYVPNSFGGGAVLTNITGSRQTYTPATMIIDSKLGPVTKTLTNETYYNGELEGSILTVTTQSLLNNPYLKDPYKISISDLQNLDISSNITISSSGLNDNSIIIPFNIQNKITNYYNPSTNYYTPQYPVQADFNIYYTASIQGTGVTQADLAIQLSKNGQVLGITPLGRISVPFNAQFSGNLIVPDVYLEPGSNYSVELAEVGIGVFTTITASFNSATRWTISIDNLSAQSTYYLDPTVYTQQNFPGNLSEFSEYNAILNNVYSNRVSNQYFDVDYSQNLSQAVNNQLIISQSALYAQVQDGNYTSGSGWYNARYGGSKNEGQYNYSQSFNDKILFNYPIDNFSNYFIYFDWIGNTTIIPGAGTLHGVFLIGPDGTSIPLHSNNKNLGFIENLYPSFSQPYIIPAIASAGKYETSTQVFDGGAVYETIMIVSSSDFIPYPPPSYFLDPIVFAYTDQPFTASFYISFASGSKTTLTDSGSLDPFIGTSDHWIQSFMRASSSLGNIISFTCGLDNTWNFLNVKIRNKKTGEFISGSQYINYEDTMFPLQYGDFIRFGKLGKFSITNSGSIETFNGGGLVRIKDIFVSPTGNMPSYIEISPSIDTFPSLDNTFIVNPIDLSSNSQSSIIFRRVPDETIIILTSRPSYTGPGFLIPYNYNPNLNPYELARKAGIIQ